MLADDGGFEYSTWGNNVTGATHVPGLAAKGLTLDQAHTSVSSCSPSRSAILTGLPIHQNGMYGLNQYPGNFESNSDITSLPNILNEAGYKTGIIGKYHVSPVPNYNFTYGLSSEHCWAGAIGHQLNGNTGLDLCNAPYNEVARNITSMKLRARQFLQEIEPEKPFFLYVGFGDCHRCGFKSTIGSFCEFYGSPEHGQGSIPDWKPVFFKPEEVIVPPFLPDNADVRADLAGQYTAVRRMDDGIGLILAELELAGVAEDTLVMFFSDNGVPFPSGKTNLNTKQGMGEPFIVYSPDQPSSTRGNRSSEVVSSLDFVPTILDWTNIKYPENATAGNSKATLTGKSMLPILYGLPEHTQTDTPPRRAFASHNYHSLYAYYPTRAVHEGDYRFVHNIASDLSFGILEDVYGTSTWKRIVNDSASGQPTGWVYNYSSYKHRPEFELYDLRNDPLSLSNLAAEPEHKTLSDRLYQVLLKWRAETHDPWLPCDMEGQNGICSL